MKKRTRDQGEIFGLSFLDVISCGFGAVILLFILTTRATEQVAGRTTEDLTAEIERVEQRLESDQAALVTVEEKLEEKREAIAALEARARAVEATIAEVEDAVAAKRETQREKVARLAELAEELGRVESEIKKLEESQSSTAQVKNNAVIPTPGQERKHYLTGLRVDGDRALILVDVSLSVLGESLTGIVPYRVATPEQKLRSRKWVRMLDSLDWLLATIEAKEYQVYLYNDSVRAALAGTEGQWLRKTDAGKLEQVSLGAWNFAPEGGSNLERAFLAAAALEPAPANIYLLTDGLPTLASGSSSATASPGQRQNYFSRAQATLAGLRPLPSVHTILFPLQGDSWAPYSYWLLAHQTGGSFFAPARSWPN